MNKFSLGLFFCLISQFTIAQEEPITLSDSFVNISFTEFVHKVEQSIPVRFYYNPGEIENLKINVSGTNIEIRNILDKVFSHTNYLYYIDTNMNIIIYKGEKITELPDYKENYGITKDITPQNKQELTSIEKKYLESKKIADLELIEVGNQQNSFPNKTCFLRGKIIDQSTGELLIGATVYLKELGQGAVSDLDGYFNLAVKKGTYLVEVNCMSMKEKKFYLKIFSNGNISIPLEKKLMKLKEVTVTANKLDNVKGLQMGYERLSVKNIKEIPVVLGEKDLLKVAQMLPGVQSAGEGSSGIYVRGGTADQNLVYINKVPIYNTSHLFGFFTAFNSDIVSNFELYKSNIPAKYGGRVSSIFEISTRKGNKKKFFGKGGISPITGHLAIEGPVKKDKTSFVLSYRGSYSDWLLSKMKDENLKNSNTSFYDLSGSINSTINKNNILKVFLYNSNDQFSLSKTDDYSYYNRGSSVCLKHFFSQSLHADIATIFSQYGFGHNNKNNPSEAYSQKYKLDHYELKTDFTLLTSKNHQLSFGGNSIFYKLNRGTIKPYNDESIRLPIEIGVEKGIETAAYISDEFTLLPKLTILAGLRYSYFALLGPATVYQYFPDSPINANNIRDSLAFKNNEIIKNYSGFEPRLALNYRLGTNNSIKASYNRLRQYIFMLSNTIAMSPTDQWKLSDLYLKPPILDQLSIGYYHDFPKQGIITSFEAYKKWGKNIVEYRDGIDFISDIPAEMLLLQGKQKVYGVEVLIKKNTGNLTGWISYTYSKSTIQVQSSLPTEQINYGKPYPSNYDKPHSINFVSNIRSNRRLSFSINVVYSTGRPITYPVATYYHEGQEILHFSERNKYRIPDYFRVDCSINLEGNLRKKKWLHSYWMLNIYNLTGRKNAYSVYFESTEGNLQGYKLSIFAQPIITLSWNFKFGNYASE